MKFGNVDAFYGLIAAAVLGLTIILLFFKRKKELQKAFNSRMFTFLAGGISFGKQLTKIILAVLVFVFVITALSRPQFGTKIKKVDDEGYEVVFALDISKSMLAEDALPNRLERAKLFIKSFANNFKGSRFALIGFAGDAAVLCPLTFDTNVLYMILDNLTPDFISSGGTNFSAALFRSQKLLEKSEAAGKVVILISDGENTVGSTGKIIEELNEKNIRLYTIGVGSPEGSPIPVTTARGTEYIKNKKGEIVVSKLDETLLRSLASQLNGEYFFTTLSNAEIKTIYNKISNIERTKFSSFNMREYIERYQIPLSFAIIILCLEILLSNYKKRDSSEEDL